MAFKLLYLEDALADLEVVFNWSREKHPGSTDRFATDLFNHLELLTAFPHVGTPIQGEPNVRRLLHSPLYVYYRVDEAREAIQILHLWHRSRRQPKL